MAAAVRRVNWLAIWLTIGVVVVVVGVGTLAVWMNRQALALAESPASAAVNQETGAIVFGDGPNELTEYVDFMCPVCHRYHDSYGSEVAALVEEGRVTLNLHPISILDGRSQGTQYSTRSAGALYCVAEDNADAAYSFMDALFKNAPSEGSGGLDDDELLRLAQDAGASADVESCIAGGEYMDFVTARTQETPVMPGNSGIATPTVLLNDEFVNLTWDAEADIVSRLQ